MRRVDDRQRRSQTAAQQDSKGKITHSPESTVCDYAGSFKAQHFVDKLNMKHSSQHWTQQKS